MSILKRLALAVTLLLSLSLLCRAQEQKATETNAPPTSDAPVTSATGTPGKIPKFTTASNIEDSVMTENNTKIGINVAPPTATLHVNGVHPSTLATNGTAATLLLQTSGGKGGNTSGAGKTAGKGAGISLVTGDGGDAVFGSTNGDGGSITLQPGKAGTGGGLGQPGNVLIAPTVGQVLIGTPSSIDGKLAVKATSGTAILGESSDSGVVGLSGVKSGVYGHSNSGFGVWGDSSTGQGVWGSSNNEAGVKGSSLNGYGVQGLSTYNAGVYGYSAGSYGVQGETSSGTAVFGRSTYSGTGVTGNSTSGAGVTGHSDSNVGVSGTSFTGDAVKGQSNTGYAGNFIGKSRFTGNMEIGGNEQFGNVTRQMLNLYNADYGIGVQNNTLYFRSSVGYNWYKGGVHNNTQNSPGTGGVSLMRLDSSGNLVVKGSVTATNISNPSDRALKANFATVNPRAVLDRLAAMPVQTWNYKSEGEAVRHMGPMAQDFKAAFNLGTDDKTISTVDTAGVTMAAIQGLYQQNQELMAEVRQLRTQVQAQQAQLNQVRRTIRGRRARVRAR